MKYLKTYEQLLKKTDDRVINHPLKELINKFIELLTILAEISDKKFKIETYYTEDRVKISYKELDHMQFYQKRELFLIQMFKYYDNTYSITQEMKSNRDWTINEDRKFVYESLRNIFDKYISEESYFYRGGRTEFTINNINNIMNDIDKLIKELEIKKNANKYNL